MPLIRARFKVVVVALAASAIATVSTNTASGSIACGSWVAVPSASGNVRLYGIRSTSPSDAWAVGHKASKGLKVMLEHWNGSTWASVAPPTTTHSPR